CYRFSRFRYRPALAKFAAAAWMDTQQGICTERWPQGLRSDASMRDEKFPLPAWLRSRFRVRPAAIHFVRGSFLAIPPWEPIPCDRTLPERADSLYRMYPYKRRVARELANGQNALRR